MRVVADPDFRRPVLDVARAGQGEVVSMGSEILERMDRERMLRSAYRIACGRRRMQGLPLWAFVSEVTTHGSTVAMQICRELGWEPDMRIGLPLPERARRASEGP